MLSEIFDNFTYHIVPSKLPWVLQLKHQNLRVGGYTENSLKWFNYPHARAHPGCEVICHGTEWTCIVGSSVIRRGQSNSEESCIVLQSGPTCSLVAKFRSVQLSLGVREFHAAGEERCKWGHRRVCANLWCLMSCHSADPLSDSLREKLAWWAVTLQLKLICEQHVLYINLCASKAHFSVHKLNKKWLIDQKSYILLPKVKCYPMYLAKVQLHSQVLSGSHHSCLLPLWWCMCHFPVVWSVLSMYSCVQSLSGVCCQSHTNH